ncbi:glycoside hydrolase family 73 protein [Lactiplantibacillus fabifermentans]|uniref:Muramidase n=2 Tax=Lactiplantibacillus fabifermentans TaxID=483011 RepID=A0A0R2P0A9_9LACO|nr:glycoside hydrolase family 73 protein [Lactiplantibacillus fabifermentans]ETY74824.1 cell wall hydrolase [Lactiplantibacillus fabifermentans T30PCM01]KRO28410.1 muramidase [Lactiplantibacillus fabifermentans DSM 21115]
MAKKRRRTRRKKAVSKGFMTRNGRIQWLNVVVVFALMAGLVWVIQRNWPRTAKAVPPTTVNTHSGFIKKVAPAAQQMQTKYHVLASITLSQAILESDWGQSANARQNNNLFGVKASANQRGKMMLTSEYYDGKYQKVKQRFVVYDSWQASIVGHAKTLANGTTWDSNHYAAVIAAKNYRTAAKALQAAGYATDPSYAQKLINIIQKYDLQRYDRK